MSKFSFSSMRRVTNDASAMLSRAKQYTEEKLIGASKTEYDSNFGNLCDQYEKTKKWTEKLKSLMEIALQPNPNTRMEDYIYSKLDKQAPERLTNLEHLGVAMVDAGADLTEASSYSDALRKCGESEILVADEEHKFFASVISCFLQPMCNFLEGDSKTIQRERKKLESKRLDLDVCKNKVKKAKSSQAKEEAENELRLTQTEFDRQQEITRLLLEGTVCVQTQHTRGLLEFIDAQTEFHKNCLSIMTDLKEQLNDNAFLSQLRSSQAKVNATKSANNSKSGKSSKSGKKQARVLYDYEAANTAEISLLADEVITLEESISTDQEFVLATRGSVRGKVPVNYINVID